MGQFPDISLKHLAYFEKIYKAKSYAIAADELNISNYTLRAAIKAMQRKLGKELFYKDKEVLEPTKEGVLLYTTAKDILDRYQLNYKLEEDDRDLGKINFTILACTTIAHYVLPHVIGKIQKKHPNYTINVLSGPEYFKDIFLHNFDFVIGPKLKVAGLKRIKIGDFQYYLHVSNTYDKKVFQYKKIDDIHAEELLLFSGNHFLPDTFIKHNTIRAMSSSYPLLERLCEEGQGILSIMDSEVYKTRLKKLDRIGVVEEEPTFAYYQNHSQNLSLCEDLVSLSKEACVKTTYEENNEKN